jgi:hypothetical protein
MTGHGGNDREGVRSREARPMTSQRISRGFQRLGVVLGAAASLLVALPSLGSSDPLSLILITAFVGIAVYGFVMVIGWVIGGFATS